MITVFFNGRFLPEEEVRIGVRTHALHYGTGCFEGIRAYYSEKERSLLIFRMREHYQRLLQSCKVLFISLPYTIDELCEKTTELVKQNYVEEDLYIRPLAFKSGLAVGNFNLTKLEDSFLIYTTPLGRYLDTEKGVRAKVSSWQRVSDNTIPPRAKVTGAYINTALAKTEAALAGYDEALLVDNKGHIVEGSAENIFLLRDGLAITPSSSDDILQGITRDTVITLFGEELGMKVVERSISRTEVYQADEVILVGTGAEVSPVVEVDDRKIGDGGTGPVTRELRAIYHRIVHGEDPRYGHFLTKIAR